MQPTSSERASKRAERRAVRAARQRNQRLIAGAGLLVILAVVAALLLSAREDRQAAQLQIEDLAVGQGPEAQTGDTVSVHYTGWLEDGTQFDTSLDNGVPIEVTIGSGGVIPGWEQGLPGMRAGGKRRLTIPPNLAYGPAGYGPIPPNATLIFEVELVEIK
jgi:FKBP-type peptidyl-prolyl cis-trans isomerase